MSERSAIRNPMTKYAVGIGWKSLAFSLTKGELEGGLALITYAKSDNQFRP